MKTILVSAYGCEPLKGSESGVGWNWALQMAKQNKLHVITRANNQQLIEAYLPTEIKNNIIFHYYDTPNFIKRFKNKAKGLYFYYFFWQIGIIPIAKKIIRSNHIDYTMHLTFGSMWMPTFLPLLKTPFIWGPVGGGDCEPRSFLKLLAPKQRIMQSFRYVMNKTALFNPFIFIPAVKAKTILCRTPNSANVIPKCFKSKVKVILETSMEGDIFKYKKQERNDGKIRFISTGRLLPSKNILSAIRSLKYLPKDLDFEYYIIGSGAQKKAIKAEITAQQLTEKVRIIDEMPRSRVLEELQNADIFLFPSLREGGSWALMEAMVIGLPVICLDWAGMSITTDDSCAVRLPVTDPEQMPKDMAEAIMKLAKDPELRKRMGKNGRKRIQTVFNWEAKGKFMEDLLAELDKK